MRESCKYGSVRGAGSNPRPYRDKEATFRVPTQFCLWKAKRSDEFDFGCLLDG